MAMPAGPWFRIPLYGRSDQKEFSNEFWYYLFSGSPPSNWIRNTTAVAFFSKITGNLVYVYNASVTFLGIRMLYNDGSGTIGYELYSNLTGTDTGKLLPEDVSAIVQKQTADSTRSGRGRWYLPGFSESFADGSYLNDAGVTAFQAVAVDFKTKILDQGMDIRPAHWNRKTNHLLPIVDTPVVSLTATRRR